MAASEVKERRPSAVPRLPSGGFAALTSTDLILLHAPSVYDFRARTVLSGPVADVVPSTDQFEMYPIGLTSLASYLEKNGYSVRIVNIAYRMLTSSRYNAAKHLENLDAPVFGIDLHWLPHAQGALEIARIVKEIHPDSAVLVGGLSASYFHEELAGYDDIDFVLRGDSTEEPARQLLAALREGTPLEEVENLTFRGRDGHVVVNPLSFVPGDIDGVDVPAYGWVLRSVIARRDLADVIPYFDWLKHPTTMLLNGRGCPYDCAVCGGSRSSYRKVCARTRPALRSPQRLAGDVATIASFSRSPIFMVHDPRVGGMARARLFFSLLARRAAANEMVFELFYPADEDFFALVERSARRYSIELTIESADEGIRRENGKFACPNAAVEETIRAALCHGVRSFDLFFMVGLPHQTPESALRTVDYCRHLADLFHDRRLRFFVAPLGPFLDPGSRAFEDPSLGYRRRFATLAEHREALLSPTWEDTLSYETDSMSRQEIVETAYRVAHALNELKHERSLIDDATYAAVSDHLGGAIESLAAIHGAAGDPEASRSVLERFAGKIRAANDATLCGDDELRWLGPDGLRAGLALASRAPGALSEALRHALTRYHGRFDRAIWQVERLPPPVPPRPRQTGSGRSMT